MSRPRASVIRWVAASMIAFWPALAVSQYTDPTTSADSPLWWPVLDRITSEELRAGHQREAVSETYRAAVAAGQAPDCGPDYVPRKFVDSAMNPELVPIWHVLWRDFVLGRGPTERDFVAEREDEIRRYGMSPDGLEQLRQFAAHVDGAQQSRQAELDERLAPMNELLLEFIDENPFPTDEELHSFAHAARDGRAAVITRPGHEHVIDDLLNGAGDPLALATTVGGAHTEWVEWLKHADVNPAQEAMARHLPQLRDALSDTDWTALRRYLASTIGNHQSASYSLLDCPQARLFERPLSTEIVR